MRFQFASDYSSLALYIPRFLKIIGEERWYKRIDQLDKEQSRSPYLWKIVADYHWLEMAISHQSDILSSEGKLPPEPINLLQHSALHFAAAVVEIHSRLSGVGQRQLEGRLRDGLKQQSGFAALYLEIRLALRLIAEGYDVCFPDLEDTGAFDLEFSRGDVVVEVECKSLSADAGRRVHRKDFFRFMEALSPALDAHAASNRKEILVITLRDRLSPNQARQAGLRQATIGMLHEPARRIFNRPSFHIERFAYSDIMMNDPTINEQAFHETCKEMFGPNTHIAGRLTETGGCVILMRSDREDDTSKPLLESLRKAASQLTARRPAFIAVQFQEIETSDLMLPHLRWRTGLLSHTLFTHHGEAHVNGTYFCGFAAIVAKGGKIGTPAFGIPNPKPKFPIVPAAAIPFLMHSTNEEFAAAIGAPFPNIDISHFLFDEMLT